MAVNNDYITVAYKLYVKDAEDKEESLVEECSAEHPFQFGVYLLLSSSYSIFLTFFQ